VGQGQGVESESSVKMVVNLRLLQCDQCKQVVSDDDGEDWIYLGVREGEHLTFCSWPCLSTYATAKALVDG
jgi:hypothetical protein